MWRLSSYPLQALIRLKGGCYIWHGEADKFIIATLGSEKINPQKIAQCYLLEFLRRLRLFLARYLYQKMNSEARHRPTRCYIVWLLELLQGQKKL